MGQVSSVSPSSIPQLLTLANATGAVAGEGGIDCDGDGTIDVLAGEPIVCSVGAGLTSSIVKVVEGIVPEIPNSECGCGFLGIVIFGFKLFCPFTRCGFFGELLGLCRCA